MKVTVTQNQARQGFFIAGVSIIIYISAVLALFMNDIIVIAATIFLLGAYLIYETEIAPINLFYAICFGASFLPYINLTLFPLAGIYIVAFLFILLTLISFLRTSRKISVPVPAKWLLVFLFFGLFSILGAPDKKQVIVNAGQFFIYICIYISAVNILEKKEQIIRAIKYVLWGSLLPLLASLVQLIVSIKSLQAVVDVFYQSIWGRLFMGSHGIERLSGDALYLINRAVNIGGGQGEVLFRVFGTYVTATAFGGYAMYLAVLAGSLYIIQRNRKKFVLPSYISLPLFLALGVCLILTWTRSGWAAFLMAFAFVVVYKKERTIKLFSKKNILLFGSAIILALALFVVLLILNVPVATNVLLSIATMSGGSVAARLETILFAVQYIIQHPFMGIGWGNFAFISPLYSFVPDTSTFATTHNRYLELGVELGLQGLIIFLIAIYTLIKQALMLIEVPNSFYHTLGIMFIAIWIGFLVKSMFAGSIIHPRTMTLLWALAGIQTAACYQYKDKKKKEYTVYHLEKTES